MAGLTMPHPDSSMKRSSAGSHPEVTMLSLLKIPITSPLLAWMPWFQALAHPRLFALRMTVTPTLFKYSGVPSVEALSTTMISPALSGRRSMDSKHCMVWRS